jgi:FkbM family methyltransferase
VADINAERMNEGSFRKRIAARFPKLRKLVAGLIRYIRIPGALVNDIKVWTRLPRAREQGLVFHPPNFLYKDSIGPSSIIVDVGCGFEADFSLHMISRYAARAIGVDPTAIHEPSLRELEVKTNRQFIHKKWLVSRDSGETMFYESVANESGSVHPGHINIRKGESRSYLVESVNLNDLPLKLGLKEIDILKLDIEGAEYDLFAEIDHIDLQPFRQIYIEFHHRSLTEYSRRDTIDVVKAITAKGFKTFSLDDINYLFYH